MKKLLPALALAPLMLSTGAQAQTVSDDVAKSLWCAEAFTVLFASEKAQVPADQMDQFNAYVAAAGKLMDKASQDYLAAGVSQADLDKTKADLVTEVTPAVTTGAKGKYGPDDCNPLLGQYLTAPSQSSTGGAAAPASSAAPAATGSSAAQ